MKNSWIPIFTQASISLTTRHRRMAAEPAAHGGTVAKEAAIGTSPAGEHGGDGIVLGDKGIILVDRGQFPGRIGQAVQVLHRGAGGLSLICPVAGSR